MNNFITDKENLIRTIEKYLIYNQIEDLEYTYLIQLLNRLKSNLIDNQ